MSGHFSSCLDPETCACEEKRYWIILGIACLILAMEIIGGLLSNSLGLLSDAGHVAVDMGAIVVSIIVARSVRSKRHHEKMIRMIGGYVNAALLGIIVVFISYEGIVRLQKPPEIATVLMLGVAIAGTFGNWYQHKILHEAGGSCGHVTHAAMKFHVFTDMLQSIVVIIGAVVIGLTGYKVIDPLLSLGIAAVMTWWTYELFKQSAKPLKDHQHVHSETCSHHH